VAASGSSDLRSSSSRRPEPANGKAPTSARLGRRTAQKLWCPTGPVPLAPRVVVRTFRGVSRHGRHAFLVEGKLITYAARWRRRVRHLKFARGVYHTKNNPVLTGLSPRAIPAVAVPAVLVPTGWTPDIENIGCHATWRGFVHGPGTAVVAITIRRKRLMDTRQGPRAGTVTCG